MGYKHNDACLAKVAEDEPIFVLRAQDLSAPLVIKMWVELQDMMNVIDPAKTNEARRLVREMYAWQAKHGCKWPD